MNLIEETEFKQLVIQFAVALATRPNTEVTETNEVAILAAKDLLKRLKKETENANERDGW